MTERQAEQIIAILEENRDNIYRLHEALEGLLFAVKEYMVDQDRKTEVSFERYIEHAEKTLQQVRVKR